MNRNRILLFIAAVGLLWLVISICNFVNNIFSVKPTQIPTATPEMLIAPKTATPTPEPTRTKRPMFRPTDTPSGIPYYSESGALLGFVGGAPPTPTRAIAGYFAKATEETAKYNSGCRIKGNISWRNDDEKIYHCPNWRDYGQTDIDLHYGDRWFCTEAEAIAAGFRKPKNVRDACIP